MLPKYKPLFFILLLVLLVLSSCKSEWSEEDKLAFMKDCLSLATEMENKEEICECGLNKTMEKFSSREQAENEVKKMTYNEATSFYTDCME